MWDMTLPCRGGVLGYLGHWDDDSAVPGGSAGIPGICGMWDMRRRCATIPGICKFMTAPNRVGALG